MPRYIEADNIEKDLVRYADSIDKTQTFSGVLRFIVRDTPTADVVPVKRGKWTRLEYDTFTCNLCGATFMLMQGMSKMNYCPNCGVKMEEDDAEIH